MEKVLFYSEFIDYLITLKGRVANENEKKSQNKFKSKEAVFDITGLRNGDHKAFELIFHRYYGKVKAFLRILTKSEELADELSQHVFVNL